jgi:hypothetical protein
MKRITVFCRLALPLLLVVAALALFSPAQPALAATGTYTFTSSPSPSGYNQEVTFTLSATGDGEVAPFGYVTFYDEETPFPGCSSKPLNMSGGGMPTPDVPAVCTTSVLEAGTHTITAEIIILAYYETDKLTLQHTVNDPTPLTISPDTLPDGVWGTFYVQQLSADGVGPYYWTWSGNPPAGMRFYSNTGGLEGSPEEVGPFAFTVTVEDSAGGRGTKDYTLNVSKATPRVTVIDRDATAGNSLWLTAEVRHPSPDWFVTEPSGAVSFSVGGVPVPGCSGDTPVPITPEGQYVDCMSYVATDLAGDFTIEAEYVPDEASSPYYAAASGTGTLHVLYTISGVLFHDLNGDGSRDDGESYKGYWEVYLDQGCDDIAVEMQYSGWDTGEFSFAGTPGLNYCLEVQQFPSWRQTTTVEPFTLDSNKYFPIAFTLRQLILSPETYQLDGGSAWR